MVYSLILTAITLTALIVATITDLKTREVPDWLSYGLISIGLGLNLLFSIIYQNYWFFLNSLIGFLLFLIIALIMFYSGQWGGGDSKVLMGLGALVGLDIRFTKFPFLINFFVNILLVGAIYGILWSFTLILKNWKGFTKEFLKVSHNKISIKLRVYIIVFVVLMFILYFTSNSVFGYLFLAIALLVLITFYLWMAVKAVEKTCMIKAIPPTKLTEGDWIVNDIKYKGKYICGPKDLGISKKQIRELLKLYKQKKINTVLIKEGIPFVPSFLIAYIITLFIGNILFLLI